MFFQHPSGTRKDLVYQNQGSVFNIIMTVVKTVNFTQNQVEERTSQGQVWGQETDPLLSTVPGDYRNPLVSTLGAQPAETWCPNQGLWDPPRCEVWGGGVTLESVEVCPQVQVLRIMWVSPTHGQESVPRNPISHFYLQCVLSPRRFPTSELRVLP